MRNYFRNHDCSEWWDGVVITVIGVFLFTLPNIGGLHTLNLITLIIFFVLCAFLIVWKRTRRAWKDR